MNLEQKEKLIFDLLKITRINKLDYIDKLKEEYDDITNDIDELDDDFFNKQIEIFKKLKSELDTEMVEVYSEFFEYEEILELIEFFKSNIGQKYIKCNTKSCDLIEEYFEKFIGK